MLGTTAGAASAAGADAVAAAAEAAAGAAAGSDAAEAALTAATGAEAGAALSSAWATPNKQAAVSRLKKVREIKFFMVNVLNAITGRQYRFRQCEYG